MKAFGLGKPHLEIPLPPALGNPLLNTPAPGASHVVVGYRPDMNTLRGPADNQHVRDEEGGGPWCPLCIWD